MDIAQVLEVLSSLHAVGVSAWVDSGWGIDALLGEQSRTHDDLDLVVPVEAAAMVRRVLSTEGFLVQRDWLPTVLAMRHPDGRAVDFHPVQPTADGGGDQILADGQRWHYPAPVVGRIGSDPVLCCSAQCQIAAHLGYEPDEDDRADVRRLAERFNLEPPGPYRPT